MASRPRLAGIRQGRLHEARHTAATLLLVQGVRAWIAVGLLMSPPAAHLGRRRRYRSDTGNLASSSREPISTLAIHLDLRHLRAARTQRSAGTSLLPAPPSRSRPAVLVRARSGHSALKLFPTCPVGGDEVERATWAHFLTCGVKKCTQVASLTYPDHRVTPSTGRIPFGAQGRGTTTDGSETALAGHLARLLWRWGPRSSLPDRA
jgi:hypothetical protein